MAEVLLLNASYEPVAVITRHRALALLLKDRVEAACLEAVEVQGAISRLRIPTVVRLRRYINVPRRGARSSRRGVLARDHYTCAYCGIQPGQLQRGQALTWYNVTVDHVTGNMSPYDALSITECFWSEIRENWFKSALELIGLLRNHIPHQQRQVWTQFSF